MASQRIQLGPLGESVVREMGNIGLGHAATALASMTGKSYGITIPEVEAVPLEEIPMRLGGGEQCTAGIYMPIVGQCAGHIAFLMPWECAQSLIQMLIGSAPKTPDDIGELEASVMLEVGNMINGSFLAALSDMSGLHMEATPPQLCVDMCGAVLESVVAQASYADHAALTVKTQITDDLHEIEGFFVFIPTVEGLQLFFSSLGIPEAA